MQTIEIPGATISVVDDDILLFVANSDIIVDKDTVQKFYDEIEKLVDDDYSLIIHRKNKYQLLRFEVFSVINRQSRLRALAIVADKDSAKKMIEIEAPLCEKPFAAFGTVEDAYAWLRALPAD